MPRAATSSRLDLAHPGAERLRSPVARRRPHPSRSAVVHVPPRSPAVAAPSGVCDRPRRRAGRHSQPGTAASARAVVGGRSAPGQLSGRRPASSRRTVVGRATARRAGTGFRRGSLANGHCGHEHTFDHDDTGDAVAGERPGLLVRLVLTYQRAMEGRPSPCRFTPTCSSYALEALQVHGRWHGLALTARRLLRCRPFGPSGWDPVPDAPTRKRAAR